MEDADVFRHLQFAARLVPAGTVENENGVTAGHHLGGNLDEVLVHRLGVGPRQDESGADVASRTDSAKDIGPGIAGIFQLAWSRALLSPDVAQGALLSDPSLVLPP